MLHGPAPGFGPGSAYVNTVAIDLMRDYLNTGDVNKALPLVREFIKDNHGYEDQLSDEAGERICQLSNLFQEKAKYTQALKLYELVIAQREKRGRPYNFDELNAIAWLNQYEKNYKAAEKYLRKAIELQKQQSKPIPPRLYHWLGYLLLMQQEDTQALPLYRQSLQLMYAQPGYNKAEIGLAECELVLCLKRLGSTKEAEQHEAKYRELLPFIKKAFQK